MGAGVGMLRLRRPSLFLVIEERAYAEGGFRFERWCVDAYTNVFSPPVCFLRVWLCKVYVF